MRRREFIAFVGGAAIALPRGVFAQQPIPVIVFFNSGAPSTNAKNVAAFRNGLKEAGLVEGQNLAIEFVWARHLLRFTRQQLTRWVKWMTAQPLPIRLLLGGVGLVFVAVVLVLDPRPGRTADEVAREAGAAVPTIAGDLRAAAEIFDEVWYGGRPATPQYDALMRQADDRVRRAEMVVTGGGVPAAAGYQVPR